MGDVDDDATAATGASAETSTSELRGSVLDVVRTLLAENDGEAVLEIDAGELAMLLEGIDAPVIKRRKRYRMLEPATTVHAVTR